MRRQRSEQEKDLSAKVLDISLCVVKYLFPLHVYPIQNTLKEALKGYFTENFAKYMSTLSENEFTNHFHGGCTASAAEIIQWKESPQVDECYCALFEKNSKGVFWVSIIARTAISMNDFDNGGPNHNSAKEIMNSEIAGCPAAKTARQFSPELEPEPDPVPVY
ncbi:31027_t:CDS:2 [Gigaspora margarita]|uniref:31027_t:CDS:1 n=1 Tax=Gigaspora margarita TaxID=4874 RepID=A0ABN7VAH6_GIGMA|nr:31027_t:CDS:2 [Gigaspora margarita]